LTLLKAILYGCIRVQGKIKFEEKEPYFQSQPIVSQISNFRIEKSVKMKKIMNDYNLFGLDSDENLAFFCVTSSGFPIRIANDFLLEMRNKMKSISSLFKDQKKYVITKI
jgi:hypothetical protein